MDIVITSGKTIRHYEADTGQEAVQLFFDDILSGKIALSELGGIGEWSDTQETYPFRIVPALVKAGLITHSHMRELFKSMDLTFSGTELIDMMNADAWMVRQQPDTQEVTSAQYPFGPREGTHRHPKAEVGILVDRKGHSPKRVRLLEVSDGVFDFSFQCGLCGNIIEEKMPKTELLEALRSLPDCESKAGN